MAQQKRSRANGNNTVRRKHGRYDTYTMPAMHVRANRPNVVKSRRPPIMNMRAQLEQQRRLALNRLLLSLRFERSNPVPSRRPSMNRRAHLEQQRRLALNRLLQSLRYQRR